MSIRDLARVILPDRGRRGAIAMLEFYADDSGTHDGAPVVVWGGWLGTPEQFNALDEAWKAVLADPAGDGSLPSLSHFSSYDCARGQGQFARREFTSGALDLVRNRFRTAILNQGLFPLSFGVCVDEWKAVMPEKFGEASQYAFIRIIMLLREITLGIYEPNPLNPFYEFNGQPIAAVFDKRLRWPGILDMTLDGKDVLSEVFSVTFADVKSMVGLQAADVIAYESYVYHTDLVKNGNERPNAHMASLMAKAGRGMVNLERREHFEKMRDGPAGFIQSWRYPFDPAP